MRFVLLCLCCLRATEGQLWRGLVRSVSTTKTFANTKWSQNSAFRGNVDLAKNVEFDKVVGGGSVRSVTPSKNADQALGKDVNVQTETQKMLSDILGAVTCSSTGVSGGAAKCLKQILQDMTQDESYQYTRTNLPTLKANLLFTLKNAQVPAQFRVMSDDQTCTELPTDDDGDLSMYQSKEWMNSVTSPSSTASFAIAWSTCAPPGTRTKCSVSYLKLSPTSANTHNNSCQSMLKFGFLAMDQSTCELSQPTVHSCVPLVLPHAHVHSTQLIILMHIMKIPCALA
jgi:hypothetical protein